MPRRSRAFTNQGIEDRSAIFETERRSTIDIEQLLRERVGRFPAIVVERDGHLVAWASAGTYRDRPCYDPIVEHSVYVASFLRTSPVAPSTAPVVSARWECIGAT